MQCAVCTMCGCLLLTIVFTSEKHTHRALACHWRIRLTSRRENAGCADSAHDMRYDGIAHILYKATWKLNRCCVYIDGWCTKENLRASANMGWSSMQMTVRQFTYGILHNIARWFAFSVKESGGMITSACFKLQFFLLEEIHGSE